MRQQNKQAAGNMPQRVHVSIVSALFAMLCLPVLAGGTTATIQIARYMAETNYAAAHPLATALHDSLRLTDGPRTAATLASAHTLLLCDIALGRTGTPSVLELARNNLTIRRQLLGPDHLDVGFSHSILAVILDWNQAYRPARSHHDQALAILRKQLTGNDRHLGLAVLKAGGTYREMRRYDEAESLMNEAHTILLAASGPNSLDVAETLIVKSNLYRNRGRLNTALATAEQALAIQLAQLPGDHLEIGHTQSSLGYIYNSLQRFDEGFAALDRSIDIFSARLSPDHPIVTFALTTTAGYLMQHGQLPAAEKRLQRALSIRGQVYGVNSMPYSVILVRLGRFYTRIGEYEKASECQQQVVAIRRHWQPSGDNTTASALWSLAGTKRNLGDLTGAKQDLLEALTLQADEEHPNPFWQARIHKELGRVEMLFGDQLAARDHLNRACAVVAKYEDDSTERDDLLLVNGDLLLAEGHLNEARESYSEAGRLARLRGPAGRSSLAAALERRASLEISCSAPQEAEAHLHRALDILTEQLGPDHPEIAEVSLDLAIVMAAKGNRNEALNLVLSAEQISRAHFRRIARTMSEASALRYARIRPAGISQGLDLVNAAPSSENIGAIWGEVAASRSLVLDEITGRYRQRGSISVEASTHQQALEIYANLLVRGPNSDAPDLYPGQLAAAKLTVEQCEKVLAAGVGLNRPPVTDQAINMAQMKQAMPDGTTLLAFIKRGANSGSPSDAHYFAFLMPPALTAPVFWHVGNAARIDGLVAKMRSSLALPESERQAGYREPAAQLRQLIWDPMAAHCPENSTVLVVPDGTLNLVSLGALPVDEDRYLLEEKQFHYLTAERDLWRESSPSTSTGILALGGIDFDADIFGTSLATAPTAPVIATQYRSPLALCPTLQDLIFAPLPGSAAEVANVAADWKKSQATSQPLILTGAAATEQAFKESAAGKSVIHLATHGFVVGSDCANNNQGFRGVGGFVPEESPLITQPGRSILALSGLALAGANQRFTAPANRQDGILTSLEIATLNLTGTSLVVLSGCDTGGGTIEDGEGIFGLRRAVHIAGAETLIMSLWPAEDEITRDWMRTMYDQYLFAEKSIPQAVRLASLDALYKRRAEHLDTHPAFWGCFIASGGEGQ